MATSTSAKASSVSTDSDHEDAGELAVGARGGLQADPGP